MGTDHLGKILCKWKTAKHNKEGIILVERQSQEPAEIQRFSNPSHSKWRIMFVLARQMDGSEPQRQVPRIILFCKKPWNFSS